MRIAETVLSSQHAETGHRLTTMILYYPRWIHAEQRTHRALRLGEVFDFPTPSIMEDPNLSRNAGSSRALPVMKMIQDVIDNPAIPIFWGKNKSGMQSTEEFTGDQREELIANWLKDRDHAIERAKFYASFGDEGCHKQIVNRILEPYSHIRVLVSGTEWSNFIGLRDHEDAEPHIRRVAQAVRVELAKPPMQVLEPQQWHIPFVSCTPREAELRAMFSQEKNILAASQRISAACNASVSYKTVDDFDMDLPRANKVYEKLVSKPPLHASPFEHIAQADAWVHHTEAERPHRNSGSCWLNYSDHRNFVGFRQMRAMLPNDTL